MLVFLGMKQLFNQWDEIKYMHVYFLCIDYKKSYCCEYLQMMNEVLKICDKCFAISRLPPDTIDQKIAKIKIINCSKHLDQPNDRSKSMYPK